jgi:hypothetical protein
MENRRVFLKKVTALGGGVALTTVPVQAMLNQSFNDNESIIQGEFLTLEVPKMLDHIKPLSKLNMRCSEGKEILVYDGNGNEYFRSEVSGESSFLVGGALGNHMVLLLDKKKRIIDMAAFKVDAQTEIIDKGEEFKKMLEMLVFSCRGYKPSYYKMQGKTLMTYAGWFQDHVHVFKAMKYFDKDATSGMDLWAMGQREDGMLADNCYHPWGAHKSWLTRFGEKFVWTLGDKNDSSTFYIRIPVENMSEFTFLEGIYYAWKASGDDVWMSGRLDNCIKAVEYAMSDDYRWSEKYQLLKRGYTIDIWDFTPEMDNKKFGGDHMMAKPGITDYNVMFGDNVGMAVGCQYLAEMLEHAGRDMEAEKMRAKGEGLLQRLNDLSWNGEFYTHHVPEDPSVVRDFGDTPLDRQVTISNSYAMNRRIGHNKAKALIKTYQRIRNEMPESSPGEWYLCYPPYEKAWHLAKWEYMNGGVSSIVGGEVAHGAFQHGFEDYGVDCLRRMNDMAQISGNFMKCIYRGKKADEPKRTFNSLSLTTIANADTHGTGAPGVPGFTGEGSNDLSRFPVGKQEFDGIPFKLIDPANNGRKACLIISQEKEYVKEAEVKINASPASIYVVHTASGGRHMGEIVLSYEDGSTHKEFISHGANISGWWYPSETNTKNIRLAKSVSNERSLSVGAFLFGFNNPHTDKNIKKISFVGAEAPGKWIILGITTSDYPVWYKPSPISYGAPDNWGAAAVIYAMLEGLGGMKDTGIAYNEATIAPRWDYAGVNEVSATAKYEASGGYVSYKYKKSSDNEYLIKFTGTAENILLKLPIPTDASIESLTLDGEEQAVVGTETVEKSSYLLVATKKVGAHVVKVRLV